MLGDARDHALVEHGIEPVREPCAHHARLGQKLELAIGDLRPRRDDGAQAVGKPPQAVQRDLVIMAVHHRIDDDPARQAHGGLHDEPVVGRRVLEFELAEHVVGLQRELFLRPDEMEMRVARAGRQLHFGFL